ncbi:hypothetical protein [Streptomyces sp. SID13031]|uniref:hypothetical protein n=1 Tax=Streptomyces sp. SID13031 TaxID=2706046 RepID=UPI00194412A1|nr:hypothetical protein [Streptomyces sp. SID13031]
MAEQADSGSILDQAAADGSITDARHRAVDPVPIVVADVTDGADLATLESADGAPPAPIWRVRRKLSPRPVPSNRRRKPPVQAPATDEEPTLAEEMDDVGTQPDKAAKTADAEKAVTKDVVAEETPAAEASTGSRGTTATATKPAKPKTAAEIVAEQKAREKAAAEAPQDTAVTKPVTRQPAAPSTTAAVGSTTPKPAAKPVAAAKKTASSSNADKGKAALSAVGSSVKRFRNVLASLIWLIAVIAAAVLALGALFTALDQANQSNEIVKWVLERGHDLVGPFKDLFRLETAKNTLLVNWGIAALVYLTIGKIAERFIRP